MSAEGDRRRGRERPRMTGQRLAEIRRYVARCPHDIAMRELLAELDATVADAVKGAANAFRDGIERAAREAEAHEAYDSNPDIIAAAIRAIP